MTLRNLIEEIIYEDPKYLDKPLAFYIKDNPDGTYNAISIKAIGISDDYILLSNKCPLCDN